MDLNQLAEKLAADDHASESVRNIAQRVYDMEVFIRSCRDNFDCDSGADGEHPHYCRKCEARRLLKRIALLSGETLPAQEYYGDAG